MEFGLQVVVVAYIERGLDVVEGWLGAAAVSVRWTSSTDQTLHIWCDVNRLGGGPVTEDWTSFAVQQKLLEVPPDIIRVKQVIR